jgi:hypothetical protein
MARLIKHRASKLISAATLAVFLISCGSAVFAYFTAHGSGAGASSVGTLNPPTGVQATVSGASSIGLSWTASATTGGAVAPSGYNVSRIKNSDSSVVAVCGTPGTPVTGTSCSDTSVPNGTFHYVITAIYNSWTAASASSNDVTLSGDTTAPTVTSDALAQTSGATVNGFIKPNASYFVYANATDAGSGVKTVTADVSNFTTGQSAVALTSVGGPFTSPAGTSFTYRSASLTATRSSGSAIAFTVNATDNSNNASGNANNGSASVDTASPTVPTPTVTAGYYTTLSVSVGLGNVTDTGSGVNASSIVLQRDEIALANGLCGTFPGTFATTVTLSGGNDVGVVSGFCYQYRRQASDNVGNLGTSALSGVAMVDGSAPTTPTLSSIGPAQAAASSL